MFLQNASLQVSWVLAFRCIVLRERELKKNEYLLAILRCAEAGKFELKLKANPTINVCCHTDHELNCKPTLQWFKRLSPHFA